MTSSLTGTGALLRLQLRRDRIRVTAWTIGIAAFVAYFLTAYETMFKDLSQLQAMATLLSAPTWAIMTGPGYGLDADITYFRLFTGVYWLYFLVPVALMNIFLVSRHTRAEEASGRAELVRASSVGANAPLSATLLNALISNTLVGLALAGGLMGFEADATDAFLLGAATFMVGMVFAGVTAVTAQLAESSKAASGLAGAVLGVAFLLRGVGDTMQLHGNWISWLSPIAWAQQTRGFYDPRWWPLLIGFGVTVVLVAAGYALSAGRDLGAGVLAGRPGPASSPAWAGTPEGFAWRQHRGGVIWWTIGLAIMGLAYGVLTQSMLDLYDQLPPILFEMLGGAQNLTYGYLNMMVFFMAGMAVIQQVTALAWTRTEETDGRSESLLATAVSKLRWLGSNVLVVAASGVWLTVVGCFAVGAGAAMSTGNADFLSESALAGLLAVPAMLIFTGIAVLLYALSPRLLALAWIAVAFGWLIQFFGPLMNPPQWVMDLSPWSWTPEVPLTEPTWSLLGQSAVAAVLLVGGLWLFTRRDTAVK